MSRNSHLQKHLCLAVTMVTILFGIVTDAAGQTATRPQSKKQRVMTGVRFEGKTSTVSMVIKGGPAAKAGVKVGDEILSVGEKYIIQPDDLLDAIENKRSGDVVKLEIKRKNQFMFFNLKLIEAITGNVEINADGSVTDLDEPGILDELAPELTVNEWSGISEGISARLESNRGKVICLLLFQADCEWTQNVGLPDLKAIQDKFKDDPEVLLLAIHTPFRNYDENTFSNALQLVEKFEVDVPVGHDGSANKRTVTYDAFNAYGTPWFVVVDKQGVVRFNDITLPLADATKLFRKLKR